MIRRLIVRHRRPRTLRQRLARAVATALLGVITYAVAVQVLPTTLVQVQQEQPPAEPAPLSAADKAEQDRRWFAWQTHLAKAELLRALRRHPSCQVRQRSAVIPSGLLVRRSAGADAFTARPVVKRERFDVWMTRTPSQAQRDPGWVVAFCYRQEGK